MGLDKLPTFVTSDSHFFHERIMEYADRPYDHEKMMVKRWQQVVKDDDVVLHLGDLFFGGREGYNRFLVELTPRLPGKKYLILGNHDKKKFDYETLGFTVIKPYSVGYRGYEVSFAHYPRFIEGRAIHVHGHIHRNGYAGGELERFGNVNVSVEATDYWPRRVTRLLNRHIQGRGKGGRYYNSKGYRSANSRRQRWSGLSR